MGDPEPRPSRRSLWWLLGPPVLFCVAVVPEMLRAAMPEWLFGMVGAAAALSAIVPMAVFVLAIGTMWSGSVLGLHERTRGRQRQPGQVVTLVAGGLALGMTDVFPNALVRLSVISYGGLAQLRPLVVIALVRRRMSLSGGVAGLVAGLLVVVVLMATGNDPWGGVNAGAIGLVLNLLVMAAVSLARPGSASDDRLAAPELVPARSGTEEDHR